MAKALKDTIDFFKKVGRSRRSTVQPDAMDPGNTESTGTFVVSPARQMARGIIKAKNSCQTWQVLIVITLVIMGHLLLIFALSVPEWFIIIQPGPLEGHVGFFSRCIYGPAPNESECLTEIVHETSSVVCMFIGSLMTGTIAVIQGLILVGTLRCQPTMKDARSSEFQRLRTMLMISCFTNICGMGTFTYLYHDFLSPPGASYSLGWLSTGILMAAYGVSFVFKNSNKIAMQEYPQEPIQLQSQRTSTTHVAQIVEEKTQVVSGKRPVEVHQSGGGKIKKANQNG